MASLKDGQGPDRPPHGESCRWRTIALGAAVLAVCGAIYVWNVRDYYPFIADDALISLRYSQRLLEGKGLTWNDDRPVEGYSNLLWVLACAGLGALRIDLVRAAQGLGIACTAAMLLALIFAARRGQARDFLWAALPSAFLVSAGPVLAWSIGGLEQPMVGALLAWAAVTSYPLLERESLRAKAALLPGLLLGLICLARPDGALFAGALGLAILLVQGLRWSTLRLLGALALFPLVLVLGQLVFRLAYYGDWVPNTAYAKVALSDERLRAGLKYLRTGVPYLLPFLIPALAALLAALFIRELRRRALLLVLPLIVWIGYLAIIGGDIFPSRRHLLPALVLLGLALTELLRWISARGPGLREHALAGLSVLALLFAVVQPMDQANKNAIGERWEWQGETIGGLLRTGFPGARPLIAVDAAGCLPYFSRLPAIDMMGLNDHYIARHRPPDFGRGWVGHELGHGPYVLGRRPDVIIYGYPTGGYFGNFLSGKQMQKDPLYFKLYRPVTIEGVRPRAVRSLTWFRRDSERIGIRRRGADWVVPGYLLTANPRTIARPDERGVLSSVITPAESARITDLQLPAGRYRVRLAGSAGRLRAELRHGTAPAVRIEAGTGPSSDPLTVNGPELLTVEVGATPGPTAFLREVVFSPQP